MKYMFLVLSVLLAGCVSSQSFEKDRKAFPRLESNKARLIIFRTKEDDLYWGKRAPMKLNQNNIGKVGFGGFLYTDILKGDYILSTESWDVPGKCKISFQIQEVQKEYYFEVKPRHASYEALTGGDSITSFIFPVISGMIALSKESEGKQCGGVFSITPVTKQEALKKLIAPSK